MGSRLKEQSPNLLRELDEKLSSIKLDKTKCLSQDLDMRMDDENDDTDVVDDDLLLMSVDPMGDDEFFGNSLQVQSTNQSFKRMMDQCTQTDHLRGVFIPETEIPKIRYNGKLLSDLRKTNTNQMSHSAIFWTAEEDKENFGDLSTHSMYTPTLRANNHSIHAMFDDFVCSDADSDTSMASNGATNPRLKLKFNQSLPINIGKKAKGKRRKEERNGCKMLNEYKRSQLALNPNHTFC